jgi:hypothetical protein
MYLINVSCLQSIEQPVAQEPGTQISRVIAQIHRSFKDNPALHLAGDLLAPAQSLSQFKKPKQLFYTASELIKQY